jgi:hypothetical protein
VGLPKIKPERVTVTAVLAASVAPAVVMTMEVAPGGLMGVNLALPADTVPVGVALVAKKPGGYDSVMLLPAASAPAAVVVNENVAVTPVLPTTRSPLAIANETPVTYPPMTPDAAPADGTASASVCTVTPVSLPAVAAPICRPVSVMMKAVLAAIPTTAVVMTMESSKMADVAVMVLMDVLPAALAAGLKETPKNLVG